jgi:hypothetical protein
MTMVEIGFALIGMLACMAIMMFAMGMGGRLISRWRHDRSDDSS